MRPVFRFGCGISLSCLCSLHLNFKRFPAFSKSKYKWKWYWQRNFQELPISVYFSICLVCTVRFSIVLYLTLPRPKPETEYPQYGVANKDGQPNSNHLVDWESSTRHTHTCSLLHSPVASSTTANRVSLVSSSSGVKYSRWPKSVSKLVSRNHFRE